MRLKKFNKLCGYISGILILISALVILYDVVSRYFLNSPSLYAPYISAFLMLGAIFIGTAYALEAGGHVYVELLVDKFKPLPRKLCFTVGYVFSLIFVFALTKSSIEWSFNAVENNWRAQGNLPIPSVLLYGVMAFGSVLLIVTLILKLIETWKGSGISEEVVSE